MNHGTINEIQRTILNILQWRTYLQFFRLLRVVSCLLLVNLKKIVQRNVLLAMQFTLRRNASENWNIKVDGFTYIGKWTISWLQKQKETICQNCQWHDSASVPVRPSWKQRSHGQKVLKTYTRNFGLVAPCCKFFARLHTVGGFKMSDIRNKWLF